MTNRRQHYRIVYAPGERPAVRIRGESYPILDLSEVAARVEMSGMKTGDRVVLGFRILDAMLMRPGIVYRAVPGETVVLLDQPLPRRLLLGEQQRLIRAVRDAEE